MKLPASGMLMGKVELVTPIRVRLLHVLLTAPEVGSTKLPASDKYSRLQVVKNLIHTWMVAASRDPRQMVQHSIGLKGNSSVLWGSSNWNATLTLLCAGASDLS